MSTFQQQTFNIISSIVGQNNIIPIPVEFVRFTGDYHTSALLNQLIYWQGKSADPDGWIYKTYDDWGKELALSKFQVSRSAKTLIKMGLLETKTKKINLGNGMFGNTAVHYKFNESEFIDLFSNHLKSPRSKETSLPGVKKLHTQELRNLTSLPYKQRLHSETTTTSSSPLSSDVIAALFALVPEQYQQLVIKSMFRKALETHSELYIKQAIAYTLANFTGQTKAKFKAYLGKCLENGWAEGYEPDTRDKQAEFLHSRRQMPTAVLIQDSKGGCKVSQEVLLERGIKYM